VCGLVGPSLRSTCGLAGAAGKAVRSATCESPEAELSGGFRCCCLGDGAVSCCSGHQRVIAGTRKGLSAFECPVDLIHDHGGLEDHAASILQDQRPVFLLASVHLSLDETAHRAPVVEQRL
jgi:hypothetical protein